MIVGSLGHIYHACLWGLVTHDGTRPSLRIQCLSDERLATGSDEDEQFGKSHFDQNLSELPAPSTCVSRLTLLRDLQTGHPLKVQVCVFCQGKIRWDTV